MRDLVRLEPGVLLEAVLEPEHSGGRRCGGLGGGGTRFNGAGEEKRILMRAESIHPAGDSWRRAK